MVLQELNRTPQAKHARTTDPLSEREVEVLRLLARGMGNQGSRTRSSSAKRPCAATSAAF
jgi:hypothetical protein